MKFLSKLNRGAILSVAVLIGVIVYLVVGASIRASMLPAIKETVEKYIATETAYNLLPKQYISEKPTISKADLDKYIIQAKADIKAYYPDNEQYYKFLLQGIDKDLRNQAEGKNTVFEYTKKIKEYTDITFDGDIVNVSIQTQNDIMISKPVFFPGDLTSGKLTSDLAETLVLRKDNGNWKVVYSGLIRPSNDASPDKNGIPMATMK